MAWVVGLGQAEARRARPRGERAGTERGEGQQILRLRIGLPTRASVCARDPPSARPLKPNNAIGECTQNGPRPDSARLMTLFEKKKGAAEGTVASFSSPPRSRLLALRGQCTDATNAGWSSLA